MGINVNWGNKHDKDIQIAKVQGQVDMNNSINHASVDKHINMTNLLEDYYKWCYFNC